MSEIEETWLELLRLADDLGYIGADVAEGCTAALARLEELGRVTRPTNGRGWRVNLDAFRPRIRVNVAEVN